MMGERYSKFEVFVRSRRCSSALQFRDELRQLRLAGGFLRVPAPSRTAEESRGVTRKPVGNE
eukprot:6267077-Pyramimonas_sp.AAC.1